MNKVIIRPLRTRHKEFYDYGVDIDGVVYSFKNGRNGKKLTSSCSGKTKYPTVGLSLKGISYTVPLHEASFWTHNPGVEKPDSICDEEWGDASEYLKDLVRMSFEVNHIDHDPKNSHPENLELTTKLENREKSNKHYGYCSK